MASKRPSFPKVSEEMRRYAALLEAEMLRWPAVRTGKMFGMVSVYRGDAIFALLPATRGLFSAHSIAIKREEPAKREGEKWDMVEVHSEADLPMALQRLDEAYRRNRR